MFAAIVRTHSSEVGPTDRSATVRLLYFCTPSIVARHVFHVALHGGDPSRFAVAALEQLGFFHWMGFKRRQRS